MGREHICMGTMAVQAFARALRAEGIDPEPCLLELGTAPEVIADGRQVIPWAQGLALIEAFCALHPISGLGVLAGTHAELSDLHLPGLFLRMQDSAKAAAAFHREHMDVFEPTRITELQVTESAVVIAFVAPAGCVIPPALAEYLVSASATLAQQIVGTDAQAARLRHARPADDRIHRQVFGDRVRFGSPIDALELPPVPTERPLPHADATARKLLQPYLVRELRDIRDTRSDLVTRVSQAIREELQVGAPTAGHIARRVQLSPRGLRRALQAAGTNYLDLLASVRSELAREQALRVPPLPGPLIAARLGYADAPTFYRAFKRWTGQSLSEFRASR